MRFIAILIGKTVYVILRLLGRRGAALPGLIVEKIYPNFLKVSLSKLPEGVVVITGTNGKTTSTKMLTHILRANKRVLTNPTGSNFTRGVIASIIQHSKWDGRLPYDIAVIELDEAYAARFANIFNPRVTVALNVMRDQMDRFGEIDHTAKLIEKVVAKTTEFVILNRDDPRIAAMTKSAKCQVIYFGVANNLRSLFKNDDELHLEKVSKINDLPKADVELLSIDEDGDIAVKYADNTYDLSVGAKGTYNIQNAIAVIAAAWALKVSVENITTLLSTIKAAFGRGEQIKVKNKKVVLQLVKNPGGFRHALLSGKQNHPSATMIAINDGYADGRDVSWLWDVSFGDSNGVFAPVFTSGTRAFDMALRLKYDDIRVDDIELKLSICLKKALGSIKANETLLIYTTYTAMLDIRRILTKIAEVEKV